MMYTLIRSQRDTRNDISGTEKKIIFAIVIDNTSKVLILQLNVRFIIRAHWLLLRDPYQGRES